MTKLCPFFAKVQGDLGILMGNILRKIAYCPHLYFIQVDMLFTGSKYIKYV